MRMNQLEEYNYVLNRAYDIKLKVDKAEIPAFSADQLEDVYPDGNCPLICEAIPKDYVLFANQKKSTGKLKLDHKRYLVAPVGSHCPVFLATKGFVQVQGGGIIKVLGYRLWLMLLIAVLIIAAICCPIFLCGRERAEEAVEETVEEVVDPNIKPVESDIITISGNVSKDGQPLNDISLSLQLGNSEVATASTDAEGNYLITGIENSIYNLVATYGDSALTKMATVDNMSVSLDFVFPADDLSDVESITGVTDAKLLPAVKTVSDGSTEVKALVKIADEDTPALAVSGLDFEAMLHMNAGTETDLTLVADGLEESEVDENELASFEEICGELSMKYYDFSALLQTYNNKAEKSEEYLTETDTILELAVPFDSTYSVATYAFRYHDGEAQRLEELTEFPTEFRDGTYYVGQSTVYIFSDKFSTYAIGAAMVDNRTKGSDTISYVDEITINLSTKVITMLYERDLDSEVDAKVQIYICGEDANLLVAESGVVPPGSKLDTMTLMDDIAGMPSVGTYEGLMKIIYLDENANTYTNVDIPLSVAITK